MQKFFVPRADRKLGDRYELLECLGDGSYGWVWTAKRLQDQTTVALKIPKEQGGSNETLAEGKALLNQAKHDNVVAIYWMGRVPPDRQWYIIEMEYFPSSTLAQVLENQDSPFAKSYKALLDIYEQVLRGVAFLHDLGIAHGDIKPHNILVAGDRVKITDFGSSVQPDEMYVRSRENGGTILYSAPERLGYFGTDSGVGGPFRGDIYSLGVLLYYLSTSRTPHETFTQAARCAPFPDPRELNSSVSPALAEFTMRCLKRRPDERWPSVAEMLAQWGHVRHAQIQYAPLRIPPKAIGETQDWSSRVLAYFEKRDYSSAVRVAESEFLASNEPHALLLLLTSLYKDHKFFDCARRIEGYPLLFVKGAPFADELRHLAVDVYLAVRQYEKAEKLIDELLAEDKKSLRLQLRKASLLGLSAKYQTARDFLLDLNRSHPQTPAVLKRLVVVHEQLRETDRAAAFLKGYMKLCPQDDWAEKKQVELGSLGAG